MEAAQTGLSAWLLYGWEGPELVALGAVQLIDAAKADVAGIA